MTEPNVFDRYADDYWEMVNSAITASGETIDFFAELRAGMVRRAHGDRPAATVLDFGCGTGRSTRALAEAFPTTRFTGFDPSSRCIEVAQGLVAAEGSRVRFVADAGDALPFPAAAFDMVFTSCVFHHIAPRNRPRWLAEIRRVLADGGAFFFFEHNPYNPLTTRMVRTCPVDHDAALLQPREAAAMLRAAGFDVARSRYYFFFPRALRALRRLDPHLDWLPLGAQYYVAATRRA